MSTMRRIRAAWAALRGGQSPASPAPSPEPGGQEGPEAALGRARIELEDLRREIERLRQDYARREERAVEEVAAAGQESLSRLGRRIGPLLSQFATMRALAAKGKDVRRDDLLAMAGKLEKAFAESGLSVIGEVGAEAPIDPKVPQRLSGGDVKDGDLVRVRFMPIRFIAKQLKLTSALLRGLQRHHHAGWTHSPL